MKTETLKQLIEGNTSSLDIQRSLLREEVNEWDRVDENGYVRTCPVNDLLKKSIVLPATLFIDNVQFIDLKSGEDSGSYNLNEDMLLIKLSMSAFRVKSNVDKRPFLTNQLYSSLVYVSKDIQYYFIENDSEEDLRIIALTYSELLKIR